MCFPFVISRNLSHGWGERVVACSVCHLDAMLSCELFHHVQRVRLGTELHAPGSTSCESVDMIYQAGSISAAPTSPVVSLVPSKPSASILCHPDPTKAALALALPTWAAHILWNWELGRGVWVHICSSLFSGGGISLEAPAAHWAHPLFLLFLPGTSAGLEAEV